MSTFLWNCPHVMYIYVLLIFEIILLCILQYSVLGDSFEGDGNAFSEVDLNNQDTGTCKLSG